MKRRKQWIVWILSACLLLSSSASPMRLYASEESEEVIEEVIEDSKEEKDKEKKKKDKKEKETEAPETEAPETEAPETEPPETEAPETEPPETEAPETELPETEAPETEPPETEASETELSETETPETKAPETEVSASEPAETALATEGAPETTGEETSDSETAETADRKADVETEGDWKLTFADLSLTGDWSADVVAIAKTQIGYRESEKNFVTEADEKLGYTRYGAWYGDTYTEKAADWSTMFVDFCLYYAEVKGLPGFEENPARWIKALSGEEYLLYRDPDYVPSPGDVIFFDLDGAPPVGDESTADHSGIVIQVETEGDDSWKELTVIEGDVKNRVEKREIKRKDEELAGKIVGYMELPENPEIAEEESTVEESEEETIEEETAEEETTGEETTAAELNALEPTAVGSGYTLRLLSAAGEPLPDGVELALAEIPADSEAYASYAEEAREAVGIAAQGKTNAAAETSEVSGEADKDIASPGNTEMVTPEGQTADTELVSASFFAVKLMKEGEEWIPAEALLLAYEPADGFLQEADVTAVALPEMDSVAAAETEAITENESTEETPSAEVLPTEYREAGNGVRSAIFPLESNAVLGVIATKTVARELAVKSEAAEPELRTLVAEGEDYTVTVTFGEEAQIPAEAQLVVQEILPGTEAYEKYLEDGQAVLENRTPVETSEAAKESLEFLADEMDMTAASDSAAEQETTGAETVPEEEEMTLPELFADGTGTASSEEPVAESAEETEGLEYGLEETKAPEEKDLNITMARFFDISFMVGENEMEPAASVKVSIVTRDAIEMAADENLQAVHFQTSQVPEIIQSENVAGEDGSVEEIRFEAERFSVYGLMKSAPKSGGGPRKVAGDDASTDTYQRAAGTITTEDTNSLGITLTMFDYDLKGVLDHKDNQVDKTSSSYWTYGINSGHALKFLGWGSGSTETNPTLNDFTGLDNTDGSHSWMTDHYNHVRAVQGIVATELDGDHYPKLNSGVGGDSLKYLFDPTSKNDNCTAYSANYLFKKENGYFVYNSNTNFAELNKSTGVFTVYNGSETQSQKSDSMSPHSPPRAVGFFPFNTYEEIQNIVDGKVYKNGTKVYPYLNPDASYGAAGFNHHLGMSLTVPFTIPANGTMDGTANGTPIKYKFSGDDDMWVFIDDKLVLDIGGIHQPIHGEIDFQNQNATVRASGGSPMLGGTHVVKASGSTGDIRGQDYTYTDLLGDLRGDGKIHTLRVFYLERGGCDSNLKISFNMPVVKQVVKKLDQNGNALPGAKYHLYQLDGQAEKNAKDLTANANGVLYEGYLATGTYYLKETEAPQGYQKHTETFTIELPQTIVDAIVKKTDGTAAQAAEDGIAIKHEVMDNRVPVEYVTTITVTDDPIPRELIKTDKDGKPVSGAKFNIYTDAAGTKKLNKEPLTSGKDGVFYSREAKTVLGPGTYYLEEVEAPKGCVKHDDLIVLTITNDLTQDGKTINGVSGDEKMVTGDLVKTGNDITTYLVKIKNYPKIRIKKVSATNTELGLQGAEFKLYQDVASGTKDAVKLKVSGQDKYGLPVTKAGTEGVMTSAENGWITLPRLEDGTYYLQETKSPKNYLASKDLFVLTVNGGSVTCTLNGTAIRQEKDDDGLFFRVENENIYELPSTGSSGPLRHLMIGVAIMAIALALFFQSERFGKQKTKC